MALAKQSIATTVEGYDPFSNLCGAVHRNSFLGSGLHFTGRSGSHTRDTLEIIIERAAVAILLPNRPRSARVLPTAWSALLVCPTQLRSTLMDHCRLPSRHFRTPRDRHFALHGCDRQIVPGSRPKPNPASQTAVSLPAARSPCVHTRYSPPGCSKRKELPAPCAVLGVTYN